MKSFATATVSLIFFAPIALFAQAAAQLEKQALDGRDAAVHDATSQYFAAYEAFFLKAERSDRQYVDALDKAIKVAMQEQNLDLANHLASERKDAFERAEDEGAHNPKLLPHEAVVSMIGSTTPSKKVLYLCQSSGAMLSRFLDLKTVLRESIHGLDASAGQQFNVIFFADDTQCLFKNGPELCTAERIYNADRFISGQMCSGAQIPIPAIKLALTQEPDVLYFMSDGLSNVRSLDGVIETFKSQNRGKTTVNCVMFTNAANPALEAGLKHIAEDGHGTFKVAP